MEFLDRVDVAVEGIELLIEKMSEYSAEAPRWTCRPEMQGTGMIDSQVSLAFPCKQNNQKVQLSKASTLKVRRKVWHSLPQENDTDDQADGG